MKLGYNISYFDIYSRTRRSTKLLPKGGGTGRNHSYAYSHPLNGRNIRTFHRRLNLLTRPCCASSTSRHQWLHRPITYGKKFNTSPLIEKSILLYRNLSREHGISLRVKVGYHLNTIESYR